MASSKGSYVPLDQRDQFALCKPNAVDEGDGVYQWLPGKLKFTLAKKPFSMLTATLLVVIIIQAMFVLRLQADLQYTTLSPSMLPVESVIDPELTFPYRRSESDT